MKSRAQRYRYVRHVVSGTRPSPWSPLSLGSSLAAWYKADAGCYTDAACLFTAASSQYLSKTSPTFAPTTKMTIAFDYKPTTLSAFSGLVGRVGNNDNQFLVAVDSSGNLYLYVSANATDSTTYCIALTAITSGANNRVVIVYDGTLSNADRVAMFVNGVAQSVTPSGTTPTTMRASSEPIVVGCQSGILNFANGALARLGFSSLALSGAALTAAHTSTFWADMTAARQADWFSFYNLCEASGTRVDSTGLNNLTPTNGPTVAAGPGEGLCVNNSPVKRWEDQSGNGRHLVQNDITKQPLWIASGQNGLPVVRADGSNDCVDAAFTLAQPTDVFAVARVQTVVDNAAVFDGATANGLNVRVLTGADRMATYAGNFGPTATPASLTVHRVYRFLFSGASSLASYDAAADTTGDSGTDSADGLTLFANGNLGTNTDAEIGEFFVASAAVLVPAQPKAYLKSRWATP